MPKNPLERPRNSIPFSRVVEDMRDMPNGVTGPMPIDATEYADAEAIWRFSGNAARRLDDHTSVLDSVTSKVNKYLSRTNQAPSDELNREIAQKVSLVSDMLDDDIDVRSDKQRKIPSKTERLAVEKMVLYFTEDEVRFYLGDEFTSGLQDAAGESREIADLVPRFFSKWERLRRVASDRNAIESSVQSVQAAATIASNKEEYLHNLGVTENVDEVAATLTPYNTLTLTTINPEAYDTVLLQAGRMFNRAATEFPALADEMPEEMMTTILRRGGSGKKGNVDEDKVFAYFARKQAALNRTGNRYIARSIGGDSPSEAAERAAAAEARGKQMYTSGRRREVAKRLQSKDFRAIEYGEDFSNTLMEIADSLPGEELGKLLDTVYAIREKGAEFASSFRSYDEKLEKEVQKAIGERVTEALYVAKYLAQTDGAVSAKVLGNRITVTSMEEVMDALNLIDMGLTRITEAEQSGVVTPSYDEENRSAWHLGTKGGVLLQVKPRGEERGQYKHGVEHSEEAQINYSADVLSRDSEHVPVEIAHYRRRYALSIRLDLEGILRDVNGGKVGFDATRDQLSAALDLGSLRGSADNPNVRVARIVSLGNKLRKRELQQGRSLGYHTSLSPEYGQKDRFADLAEFKRAKYRRALGHGAVAAVLDLPLYPSSASQSEKAVA